MLNYWAAAWSRQLVKKLKFNIFSGGMYVGKNPFCHASVLMGSPPNVSSVGRGRAKSAPEPEYLEGEVKRLPRRRYLAALTAHPSTMAFRTLSQVSSEGAAAYCPRAAAMAARYSSGLG